MYVLLCLCSIILVLWLSDSFEILLNCHFAFLLCPSLLTPLAPPTALIQKSKVRRITMCSCRDKLNKRGGLKEKALAHFWIRCAARPLFWRAFDTSCHTLRSVRYHLQLSETHPHQQPDVSATYDWWEAAGGWSQERGHVICWTDPTPSALITCTEAITSPQCATSQSSHGLSMARERKADEWNFLIDLWL